MSRKSTIETDQKSAINCVKILEDYNLPLNESTFDPGIITLSLQFSILNLQVLRSAFETAYVNIFWLTTQKAGNVKKAA